MMKLYTSPTSPFVRKVLVVADELGLGDQIQNVPVVITPTSPDAGLSAKNPLGKIPALELESGDCLFDSRVIISYLLSSSSAARQVLPEGDPGIRTLRVEAAADGLLDAGILARYETVLRPEAYRWQEWVDSQCDKVERALRWLEGNVELTPAPLDLGKIATACAVGWVRFREPFLSRSRGERDASVVAPRLFAWHDTVRELPAFARTEPRG
jgi:glutathione S-transferase